MLLSDMFALVAGAAGATKVLAESLHNDLRGPDALLRLQLMEGM